MSYDKEIEKSNISRESLFVSALAENKDTSRLNLFEKTVESLGRSIKLGIVQPGEKLPSERELSKMMGVSRSTLRAAIQILVEGRFLVSRPGRGGGTFVSGDLPTPQTHSEIKDDLNVLKEFKSLIQNRLVIECGVAELAAECRFESDVHDLRVLVGEMAEKVEELESFRARDILFHLKIAQITGNKDLIRLVGEGQEALSALLGELPPSNDAFIHSNQQHAEIVSAISRYDREAARNLMREHISATLHLMRGLLPE